MPLQPATALDGRFQVECLVARGGQCLVYRGVDLHSGTPVAIKEMQPVPGLSEAEARARFRKEHDILSEPGPGLPRSHALLLEGGTWYIVEDWIDAEPLESLGPPPLPVEKAVELTVLLLRILGALHLRRPPVVVREIRPGNLLVSGEKLWLVDLSSARRLDGSLDTVAPGPPGFAAPEHYQGRSQRRSDIFSAGALLHYLLTGQVADLSHLPCSPRTLRPEVPLELDRVVRRATQMDPLNRYDSASEMARDLRLVLNPPAPARQAPDRPALADVKAPRWAVILGLAAGVAVLSAPFLPGPGLDPVWMALRWSVPALAGVFCLLGLMLLWHGLRPG